MANEDQAKGKAKDLKGKAKEEIGELTGDQKMKDEGRAERMEGKVQETWGDAKEKARD